jgi:hypothetical protein
VKVAAESSYLSPWPGRCRPLENPRARSGAAGPGEALGWPARGGKTPRADPGHGRADHPSPEHRPRRGHRPGAAPGPAPAVLRHHHLPGRGLHRAAPVVTTPPRSPTIRCATRFCGRRRSPLPQPLRECNGTEYGELTAPVRLPEHTRLFLAAHLAPPQPGSPGQSTPATPASGAPSRICSPGSARSAAAWGWTAPGCAPLGTTTATALCPAWAVGCASAGCP